MKIKYNATLSLFILGTIASNAQISPVNSFLDINNIKMSILSNGDIGWDHNQPTTEAPIGSGHSFIYSGGFWMGGLDENDSIHLAANTYYQSGVDYWPGPISNNYDSTYNRSWQISREQIETHIAEYGIASYQMPEVIENWPGNGNVQNGESQILAPFEDLNGNTFYEPQLGEHPIIRGDKAVYVIANDKTNPHGNSGGGIINAEIHIMLYGYANSNVQLNNTVFFHCEIFNRGTINYSDFYVGTFLSWDLGRYNDDYVGCDTTRNTAFIYNGDNNDEDVYGINPPAAGIVSLNTPMASHIFYNNDFSPINGNPNNVNHFYNYLSGKWKDGSDITEGEYGTNTLNPSTTYMFSGNVAENTGWTEQSVNGFPSDRTALQSEYFNYFDANSSICIDYAMIYARDTSLSNYENVEHLLASVDSIQNFYDDHYEGCSITGTDIGNLDILENDFKGDIDLSFNKNHQKWQLTFTEMNGENAELRILNTLGQLIKKDQWIIMEDAYTIDFNTNPKGTYFIEVISNGSQQTFPIVLK